MRRDLESGISLSSSAPPVLNHPISAASGILADKSGLLAAVPSLRASMVAPSLRHSTASVSAAHLPRLAPGILYPPVCSSYPVGSSVVSSQATVVPEGFGVLRSSAAPVSVGSGGGLSTQFRLSAAAPSGFDCFGIFG